MRTRARETYLGLVFLGLFALTVLVEYLAAATLYPKALALFAAIAVAFAALFLLAGRRWTVLGMTALYLVGLLTLRFVEISPVKPFRAFYESVEPGMTRADVLSELARRFPEDGRYTIPAAYQDGAGMWWTLDPTDGDYDSEFVRIELADGLVTGKSYLPD